MATTKPTTPAKTTAAKPKASTTTGAATKDPSEATKESAKRQPATQAENGFVSRRVWPD